MKATNDDGFTLVELLIVILLLGIITAIVTGAVRFGVRSWDVTSDHEVAVVRIEAAQRFLRQQLRHALYVDGTNSVVGTAEEMTFVAVLPAQFGIGGSHRYRIRSIRVDGQTSLVVEWQTFRHSSALPNWELSTTQRILLSGIGQMAISYFGSVEQGSTPTWHDSWGSTTTSPNLVSIEVDFPESDPRYWPQFLVRTGLLSPSTVAE